MTITEYGSWTFGPQEETQDRPGCPGALELRPRRRRPDDHARPRHPARARPQGLEGGAPRMAGVPGHPRAAALPPRRHLPRPADRPELPRRVGARKQSRALTHPTRWTVTGVTVHRAQGPAGDPARGAPTPGPRHDVTPVTGDMRTPRGTGPCARRAGPTSSRSSRPSGAGACRGLRQAGAAMRAHHVPIPRPNATGAAPTSSREGWWRPR